MYPHYRAIDLNGLVGYIGAYIGLFLGYSLLQIPDLILLLSRNAKKYFGKRNASVHNDLPHPTKIYVNERLPNNIGLISTTRNTDCGCKHTSCLLRSELEQMSQKVEKVVEEIEVVKGKIEIIEKNSFCK